MPAYNFINLTGKRFGRLIVIRRDQNDKEGRTRWFCSCDCGNTLIVDGNNLRRNATKSCGCFRKDITGERAKSNALPPGQAAFNKIYTIYKINAEKRGLVFELTKEDFSFLTKMNCFYCGAEPNNIAGKTDNASTYIYNGVDRVDNDRGYTMNNVVPCCALCNWWKRDLTVQDFFGHVEKIFNRRNKNGNNSVHRITRS